MNLPNTYTDVNETGCCAVPNVAAWDKQTIEFKDRHFIRQYTTSFLYVPLNMAKVMKGLNEVATSSGKTLPPQEAMTLSREISPWKAEQLYRVSSPIEGADNVTLSGTFLSQVFEGPYKDAGKWHKAMIGYAQEQQKDVLAQYFFYTSCPNCAKHYGKNYVYGLTQVGQ